MIMLTIITVLYTIIIARLFEREFVFIKNYFTDDSPSDF